jgi:hypothetical protein
MKKLIEFWKWKLIITIMCVIFFTLPIIFNWHNVDYTSIIIIYVFMPILIWLSITYSFYQIDKDIKRKMK